MVDPREQLRVLTEVMDLLTQATEAMTPIIADEEIPEMTRSFLMTIRRSIANENGALMELKRATHELVDCHCEGMVHEPGCPAAPGGGE